MNRGPKPEPAAVKLARGTFRQDRDAWKPMEVLAATDPPAMPDHLTAEAKSVWLDNLGRVMAAGVGELDSELFAIYCGAVSVARQAMREGEAVPASYLTAIRQYSELMGLAGPKSRLHVKAGDVVARTNPFAKLR